MLSREEAETQKGCWVDGHWGVAGDFEVVKIAQHFGLWENEDIQWPPGGDDYMYELSIEAENWLNDNVAPEGFSFGWENGEFFLQTDEWWESE